MTKQELAPKEKQELQEKEQTRPGRYFVADADIYENKDGLWIWADMPGVDDQHVDVELDSNVVTLRGELSPSDYEGLHPLYTEYNVGHFMRRFSVASTWQLDRDRIEARMKNGVLEVHLPKAEAARPRRIQVNAA